MKPGTHPAHVPVVLRGESPDCPFPTRSAPTGGQTVAPVHGPGGGGR
ncbi:hypothetical protein ABZ820_26420 [Streptomyces diacarni]